MGCFYLFMKFRYDELSCLHIFLPFFYHHKCVYALECNFTAELRDTNEQVQPYEGIFTLNLSAHNLRDVRSCVVDFGL